MAIMNIEISTVVYQEAPTCWVAQGLERDITAQASSINEARDRFAEKVAAELSIQLDLGNEGLSALPPAPQAFWQMFQRSPTTLKETEPVPVRVGDHSYRIFSWMKVGESKLAVA